MVGFMLRVRVRIRVSVRVKVRVSSSILRLGLAAAFYPIAGPQVRSLHLTHCLTLTVTKGTVFTTGSQWCTLV